MITESRISTGIHGCLVYWAKKSAGRSVRSPLFGIAVFYNDSDVEEFVQQHPTTSRAKEVSISLTARYTF